MGVIITHFIFFEVSNLSVSIHPFSSPHLLPIFTSVADTDSFQLPTALKRIRSFSYLPTHLSMYLFNTVTALSSVFWMILYPFFSTHPESVHLALLSFNLVDPLLLALTRLSKTPLPCCSLPFYFFLCSYVNIILIEPLFYHPLPCVSLIYDLFHLSGASPV